MSSEDFKQLGGRNDPTSSAAASECHADKPPVNTVVIFIGEQPVRALVDTGADVSLIGPHLGIQGSGPAVQLRAANASRVTSTGVVPLQFSMGGLDWEFDFGVCPELVHPLILGVDFLMEFGAQLQLREGRLWFPDRECQVPLQARPVPPKSPVWATKKTLLPPRSVILVSAVVKKHQGAYDMEGHVEGPTRPGPWLVANAVSHPQAGQLAVQVMNPTNRGVWLRRHQEIALFTPVEEFVGSAEKEPTQGSNLEAALAKIADSDLTLVQKGQATELLTRYADVFVEENKPLGRTSLLFHHIDTGNAPPFKVRGRRVPPHQRELVDEALDQMLANDVIRPSESPWSSPLLLVKKRDGTMRVCVDFRKLNEVTVRDAYPIPRIDETLDSLSGNAYFTCLDLKQGYWQLPLDEASKPKTAFSSHRGLFEFNVLAMGLTNAPGAFARLMNSVLAGLSWEQCLVYLDDTIVLGADFESHLANLELVLERFRKAGLQLNPHKCQWFQSEVRYLGHIVGKDGIRTDPATVEKVATWPQPENVRELRSFLGLANYYRKFIKDYAGIAHPLHRLTGKNVRFEWSSECDAAFKELRERLCSAPILTLPDFEQGSGMFILDTDASDFAIGGVLSQRGSDGLERVIAYGSKNLSAAEINYCVTRREMLALVHFMTEFRPYLLGRKCLVRTDHASLQWLRTFKEPSGQVARWLERLQEFEFDVEYRPGAKHGNADASSRRPQRRHGECPACEPALKEVQMITWNHGWSKQDLLEAQKDFPASAHVLAWLEQRRNAPPQLSDPTAFPELPPLVNKWTQLGTVDGLLAHWTNEDADPEIFLPPSWREYVMRQHHDEPAGGHMGWESTLAKIRGKFWWPGMREQIRDWVQRCGVCGQNRGPNPKFKAPLVPITVEQPLSRVAVDIVGPLNKTKSGHRYILTMVDTFTRWVEAVPLVEHTARSVANAILQQWVSRFGTPSEIHTDQGAEFESAVFRHMCTMLGVQKTRSSPYHPEGNGAVERVNRTLKALLRAHSEKDRQEWDQTLPLCLWAYRSAIHHTTGHSPAKMLMGRELRSPVDILLEDPTHNHPDAQEYAEWVQLAVRRVAEEAREHIAAAQQRQKRQYDKKSQDPVDYEAGDLVWLHNSVPQAGVAAKFSRPWRGPFIVVEKLGKVNVRIRDPGSGRSSKVVHVNRIKPCPADVRLDLPGIGGQPPLEPVPPEALPEVGNEVVIPFNEQVTSVSGILPPLPLPLDVQIVESAEDLPLVGGSPSTLIPQPLSRWGPPDPLATMSPAEVMAALLRLSQKLMQLGMAPEQVNRIIAGIQPTEVPKRRGVRVPQATAGPASLAPEVTRPRQPSALILRSPRATASRPAQIATMARAAVRNAPADLDSQGTPGKRLRVANDAAPTTSRPQPRQQRRGSTARSLHLHPGVRRSGLRGSALHGPREASSWRPAAGSCEGRGARPPAVDPTGVDTRLLVSYAGASPFYWKGGIV